MILLTIVAIASAGAASGAACLAYGYRGQRDQEREQVTYLRKELALARGVTPQRNDDRGAQQRDDSKTDVRALLTAGQRSNS